MLPVVGFISRVRTSLKLKQNKTVSTVGWNEAQTVGSFVLFQFYFTICDGLYAEEVQLKVQCVHKLMPLSHISTMTVC